MLFVLIGWFLLSFGIAGAAHERGRSAFGWFLISITWSPLIAGLFLLLYPPLSSVDDQTLQGTIRPTDELVTAVQEMRGAIRDGRTELQQSPPLSYSAVDQSESSERRSSVDPAWREAALEQQMTEPPRKRGVGSWILLIAVLGTGVALTVFGISKLDGEVAAPSQKLAQDPAILAKIEYDGKKPSTLGYGDFTITVNSEPAAGGTDRVPYASGLYKGKAISIHFSGKDGGRAEPPAELWLMKIDPSTTAPQVIFTYFSGGAHCCTVTKIATIGSDGNWRVVDAGELDMDGYDFKDLDGDGGRELVSIDNSFLYAFCAYACSNAPTRIKKLVGGDLRDVTTDSRYQSFLRQRLQEMEANARSDGEERLRSNGYLGGWVAAKALVGEFWGAWQKMLSVYDRKPDWTMKECNKPIPLNECPESEKRQVDFPEALAAHLVANGYITPQEKRKLNMGKAVEQVVPGSQQPRRRQQMAASAMKVDPNSLAAEQPSSVLTTPSDQVRSKPTRNSPSDQDPYAEDYKTLKLRRYVEERDRYLTTVFNLYLALGCKVFPDEATLMVLLGSEYRLFFDGNLEFTVKDVTSINDMTKARASAGKEMATQVDACNDFKQHPEKVLALRTAAQAAMARFVR
jgi:hypothetical protein